VTTTPVPPGEPRLFHKFGWPPILFHLGQRSHLRARQIIAASDWRYQSTDSTNGRGHGVLWYLPSNFVYYTQPLDRFPSSPDFMDSAHRLYSNSEAVRQNRTERRAIAEAAAWVSTLAPPLGSESFYLPGGYFGGAAADSAAPFISTAVYAPEWKTYSHFLLHV
jgi:hypothetical protein